MNNRKTMKPEENRDPHSIVFGFDRKTDERSLALFLECFSDRKLLEVLLPRLQDKDISTTVDYLTKILRTYLSEEEYHALFLAEKKEAVNKEG